MEAKKLTQRKTKQIKINILKKYKEKKKILKKFIKVTSFFGYVFNCELSCVGLLGLIFTLITHPLPQDLFTPQVSSSCSPCSF